MLTNVSSMQGYEEAYGPISNLTRAIATVVLCTPKQRPIVHNGDIVAAKIMNVMITFDHRYLDGASGSKLSQNIMDVWNNPANYY